jgi:hypothetical protein
MALIWKEGGKRTGWRSKVMDGGQKDGYYRILNRRRRWYPGRMFDYGVDFIRTDPKDRRSHLDRFAVGGADTLDEAKFLAEEYQSRSVS